MVDSLPTIGVPGLFGGASAFEYLLRAVFANESDQVPADLSTLDVDAGTLFFRNLTPKVSISGGRGIVANSGGSTNFIFDNATRVRAAGLALYGKLKSSVIAQRAYFGAFTSNTLNQNISVGLYPRSSQLSVWANQVQVGPTAAVVADTDYELLVVLRTRGAYYFVRGGVWTNWTLYWVDDTDTTEALVLKMGSYLSDNSAAELAMLQFVGNGGYDVPQLGVRDLQLCVPGTGTGTSFIASPVAGNTFVHTADCVLSYTIADVSTGEHWIMLHRIDASNFVGVEVEPTGTLKLWYRTTAEGYIELGLVATLVVDGDRLDVVSNGENIAVFVNGALKIANTIPTAFVSVENGIFYELGGTLSITNFTARTLDGVANVASSNHPGYGLATDVLAGPTDANEPFTHEIASAIEFVINETPASNRTYLRWRYTDANNVYNIVWDNAAGQLKLQITTGGSASTKFSYAVSLALNDRIAVYTDGGTVSVFVNGNLAGTHTGATLNLTATAGLAPVTAGIIRNLVTYPLYPGSAPNTPGAARVNTALRALGA